MAFLKFGARKGVWIPSSKISKAVNLVKREYKITRESAGVFSAKRRLAKAPTSIYGLSAEREELGKEIKERQERISKLSRAKVGKEKPFKVVSTKYYKNPLL